jgi:hypothetical protein
LTLFVDVVFDSPKHRQELISIEFEPGHVLFDLAGDLIDTSKECQLPVAQSIEDGTLIRGNSEDRTSVAHQAKVPEVAIHIAIAT